MKIRFILIISLSVLQCVKKQLVFCFNKHILGTIYLFIYLLLSRFHMFRFPTNYLHRKNIRGRVGIENKRLSKDHRFRTLVSLLLLRQKNLYSFPHLEIQHFVLTCTRAPITANSTRISYNQ